MVKHAATNETTTFGGLVNLIGMLAIAVIISLLTVEGVITDLVRVFRPGAEPATNIYEGLIFLVGLILVCAILSEYLFRKGAPYRSLPSAVLPTRTPLPLPVPKPKNPVSGPALQARKPAPIQNRNARRSKSKKQNRNRRGQ